ncbi:MAG: TRAP transporter substrate-binding protein [Succinatimonas sp.]|nr:TRAP transporter substrate-binding protein [Succinatimonas sp.]
MKKIKSLLATAVTCACLGCFSMVNAAYATDFELSLAHSAETNHPWQKASEKFIQLVEERSQGKIKFHSLFSAGEMGSEREMAEAIQQGNLDMILVATMGMSSFDKNLMIYDFPYMFTNFDTAYKALDGKLGDLVNASIEKKGFHVLAYLENDFRGFSNSKRPINHPSDLKGMKLRVPQSPVLVEWMKSEGASPTIMPYNEVYSAIQTGVVDGQDNGILLSYTHKIFEVNDYYTLSNHIYCPAPLIISTTIWNELTPELQKIMTDSAKEVRDYQRNLNKEYRVTFEKEAKNNNIKINELTDEQMQEFVNSAKKVWPKFEKEVDPEIYQAMIDMSK